ncbi:HAD family hydrolase [Pseudaeromonas paramecii]|uniref:HAD family hydrolase n=1 Tax=Pseudaeromonas paramecii TaxID=2138166 RepID=A0ABP8PVS7_9GAMM
MALALFDLDDTLLDGDTASLWFEHMVARGWADAAMAQQEQALMARYYAGTLAMEEYMAFTLSPLADRSQAEVADEVALCLTERILPRLYPEAQALLQRYREQGDRLIIVSASGEHIVRPVAAHLGVQEVLAIELEQADGRYTGRTQGVLSFQAGKVTRLRQWLGDELDLLGSHGYSDSINDLPLLELVQHAHVVNPGERLARLAQARGWESLQWGG